MFHFNQHEVQALAGLPNRAARLAVQRWVELTYDQTHPEWRWHLLTPPSDGASTRLVEAVEQDASVRALEEVERVSTSMLREGGTRNWRNSSVRYFLLDPKGQSVGTATESFMTRLKVYTGLEEPPEPEVTDGEGEEGPSLVHLRWPTTPTFSKSSKLPWSARHLRAGDGGADVAISGSPLDGGKALVITSSTDAATPRPLGSAVAALRARGSSLVDLLRLTYPNQNLQTSRWVEIVNAECLTNLAAPPFPRLESRRARVVLSPLLERFNADPASAVTRRLRSATHWISTAVMRWHENSAAAAACLWMALEAMFGKCVWQHRRCGDEHPTAVELYSEHVVALLADEVQEYLLAQRGTLDQIAKGRRNPPQWLARARHGLLNRGGTPIRKWLKQLIDAMEPEAWKDPLLWFRCNDLLYAGRARVDRIRAEREADLRVLYRARNELVHEGNPTLEEDRSIYLAALAVELLLLGFEHPHLLPSSAR